MTFKEFEKKVMNLLLCGDDEFFSKLRKQYEVAKVTRREFTGVGFFTDFDIDNEELRLNNKIDPFGDVNGFIDDEAQIGFLIFMKDGYLSFLEGFTYTIKWPESYDNINLYIEKL